MSSKSKKSTTEIVEQPSSGIDLAASAPVMEDVNEGFDGVNASMLAIPMLKILQRQSPQTEESSSEYVQGARPGAFYESVTGKLYSGKTGVLLVPCAFKNVFIHWGPRFNGSYKGEMTVEAAAKLRASGVVKEFHGQLFFARQDGSIDIEQSDRLVETYNIYVLVIDEANGLYTPALMSLSSTQIKKARHLLSALKFVKVRGPNGTMVTPAPYANLVRATTVLESNEKGSWYGVKFELAGFCNADLFAAGKAFKETVLSGNISARYDDAAEVMSAATEAEEAF